MKRNNTSISKLIIVLLVIAGMAAAFCIGRMVGANEVKDRSHQDHHADTTAEEDNDQYSDDSTGDYFTGEPEPDPGGIVENGEYTTAQEVAAYIHTYHKLPPNYVSKEEAENYGWHSNECPADYGIMIGGSRFGNRERLLPKGKYKECDVDYDGHLRGERRLVYTDDGTVYYTDDHYESFTQLY